MDGLSVLVNGLAHASTLFLMAAGLTLIFGVTRIVNFAHGSFYMVAALVCAHVLRDWWPSAGESVAGYVTVMLFGIALSALLGALSEYFLLRRLYGAPELYQLLATFGLSLFLHDTLRRIVGPEEVFAPRFPGLKGSVEWAGGYFPSYQLLLIGLGPLVGACLHLLLTRSRWGRRLRAATHDRDMVAALGLNPAPLMLGAVTLGCGLAGLGGVLQLPREPANLQMDISMVVETFVVVVTGGLGSLSGAFFAALLIGLVQSFGAAIFPTATQVFVFATMGCVLAIRPQGLRGKPLDAHPTEVGARMHLWPARSVHFSGVLLGLLTLLAAVLAGGLLNVYWQYVLCDILIMVVFAVSLQAMMALGGMVSFGHAAFFGVGALGAAWVHLTWGWGLGGALLFATASAATLAALFGWVLVRSAGVYLAMLSLSLAQWVWAIASQWDAVTGGDNGRIGLQLIPNTARSGFLWGLLLLACAALVGLRRLVQSPLGAALQALRDAPVRAQASGLSRLPLRYGVLVGSASLAGLAGGLFAAHKGAVFPAVASVATSVDVLLVILLGGLQHLWGSVAGASVLLLANSELGRDFDYWRGALGVLVMVIMVLAPAGLLGWRKGFEKGRGHGT